MSKVILVASGKGGVGKSTISANLAALLSVAGKSVALLDTDIGLRSLDLFFGLENRVVYDLMDVAEGRCLLSQAMLDDPTLPGLSLLPAAQFSRVRDMEPRKLRKIMAVLRSRFDYILLDAPAGLERGLRMDLNLRPDEILCVATPDDLCLRDAGRLVSLAEDKRLPRPRLLCNRLDRDLVYRRIMYSARTAADILDIPLLGEIPEDRAFILAQSARKLVIDYRCEARDAFCRIASRLLGEEVDLPGYGKEPLSFMARHFPKKPKPESLRKEYHPDA